MNTFTNFATSWISLLDPCSAINNHAYGMPPLCPVLRQSVTGVGIDEDSWKRSGGGYEFSFHTDLVFVWLRSIRELVEYAGVFYGNILASAKTKNLLQRVQRSKYCRQTVLQQNEETSSWVYQQFALCCLCGSMAANETLFREHRFFACSCFGHQCGAMAKWRWWHNVCTGNLAFEGEFL